MCNLFFCRLPLPWLIYSVFFGKSHPVSASGLVCSLSLLLLVLLLVSLLLLISGFRINRCLGVAALPIYLAFVAVAVAFEYAIIRCPL